MPKGTPETFLRLRDTPDTYAGQSGNVATVNTAEDGLEFTTGTGGATTFLALTDTPSSYSGQGSKVVSVNVAENALEFTAAGADLSALHFVTTQAEGALSNEFNLGSLTTGLLKHTVAGSVSTPATAAAGTDYVAPNGAITGATKTKITYDTKGLVTSGADATTADIADSSNKRYVTDADLVDIGNLSGTNTGDQTSIAGITGTKAQFDTAVTDGNFLYVGDVTQYTDELAQDAVGGMVDATLNYVDATPLLQRAALTGDVTASAGSNATTIANDAVTYAKMQDVTAGSKLVGRGDSGSGSPEEITLGTGLSMSGTTISASAAAADLNPNLQVLTSDYTVPANKSLVFVNSLTLSNNVSITVPSTGAIQILCSRTPTELSSTPIVDTSENSPGSGVTYFSFHTLPSTYPFYVITGIEWKNGLTLAGTVKPAVYRVDASPPVATNITLVAWGTSVTMAGFNQIQRSNFISRTIVEAGSTIGVCALFSNTATTTRFLAGQSNSNFQKTLPSSGIFTLEDSTAWTANTVRLYLKVYYRGISVI